MSKLTIPEGMYGKELFKFLITNKAILIAEKKMTIKQADAVSFKSSYYVNDKGEVVKAAAASQPVDEDDDVIKRTTVINTTNWFDSHSDVHIDGLWKKSLSENRGLYLLEEHRMSFKGIITDEVKAYTKKLSWRDLGFDIEGMTEALIFDNTIEKARNEFMFNEYRKNRVKNHSVGMRYVDMEMAINNEDYKEEFAAWNKYVERIANREDAENQGYFFPIKQARVIEGSAVPIGSNIMTPTLAQSMKSESTAEQPSQDTGEQPPFDLYKAIQETQFLKF